MNAIGPAWDTVQLLFVVLFGIALYHLLRSSTGRWLTLSALIMIGGLSALAAAASVPLWLASRQSPPPEAGFPLEPAPLAYWPPAVESRHMVQRPWIQFAPFDFWNCEVQFHPTTVAVDPHLAAQPLPLDYVRHPENIPLVASAPSQPSWAGNSQSVALAAAASSENPAPAAKSAETPTRAAASQAPPASASSDLAAETPTSLDSGRPRPAWLEQQPTRAEHAYTVAVVTDPFATRTECQAQLQQAIRQATADYAQLLLGVDSTQAPRAVPELSYLQDQVVADEYEETVQASFGPMLRQHALLKFDDADRAELRSRYRAAVAKERLASTGWVGGLLLTVLATLFGYLRIDTATRGYYSGRLKLAAATVILGSAAAAASGLGWLSPAVDYLSQRL